MNRGVLFAAGLIIVGFLLLLNSVFKWNISIFRVIIGILVVLVGISMLTGGVRGSTRANRPMASSSAQGDNSVVFGTRNYDVRSPGKYDIIFGSAMLDLTNIEFQPGQVLEVNVIFAECEIRVKKDTPVGIHSSAAFAQVIHPNASGTTWLGEQATNMGQGSSLSLRVNCVFGSTNIVEVN